MLDGEVPTLGGLQRVLGGLVGHEPGDRLGDQPLQRGQTDAVRERRHLGVHEPRRLLGTARWWLRRPGGPATASRSPACTRAQIAAAGTSAPPKPRPAHDRRRWSGRSRGRTPRCRTPRPTEHPDQRAGGRCPRPGDPSGLCSDRLRWVLLGPGHRRDQQHRVRAGRCGTGLARHPQHLAGRVELSRSDRCGRCHDAIQASTTDRNRRDSPAVEGNSIFFSTWTVVPVSSRRTALGLVCPLASLAARPPRLRLDHSVVAFWAVVSRRSLRSLLNHRDQALLDHHRCSPTWGCGPRPAYGIGLVSPARFARCSTTAGCGPGAANARFVSPSTRSLRCCSTTIAARPPGVAVRSAAYGPLVWSVRSLRVLVRAVAPMTGVTAGW